MAVRDAGVAGSNSGAAIGATSGIKATASPFRLGYEAAVSGTALGAVAAWDCGCCEYSGQEECTNFIAKKV